MKARKCICQQINFALLTLVLSTAAAFALWATPQRSRATAIFEANCSYCHGSDATGNTALGKSLGAANLHARAIQNLSDSALKMIIAHGSGRMPSFGLSDSEMSLLVSYLREISGPENVEEVRDQYPRCMRPWLAHRAGVSN